MSGNKTVWQEENKLEQSLKEIKHKIIVMSGKGGVGKSTIATNLAVSLSKKGFKVGILDADIHGPSIPKLLGIENSKAYEKNGKITPININENLKVMSIGFMLPKTTSPVIWRGPLKLKLIRQFLQDVQWDKLDYLVIDLPPGTGDESISIAQLIKKIDGALIITTPQEVALLSVQKSINFAKRLNVSILGLIENMSGFNCPYCHKEINIFGKGKSEEVCKRMKIDFLGKIPIRCEIAKASDKGKPFVLDYKEFDFSKIFENIVEKIIQKTQIM